MGVWIRLLVLWLEEGDGSGSYAGCFDGVFDCIILFFFFSGYWSCCSFLQCLGMYTDKSEFQTSQ